MRIGMYCYVWDFADQGVDSLLDWCAETGITDLFLAATYHSGWFLHSRLKGHKTYMAASGAIYFQPERELYGSIQPYVAPFCEDYDYFREITEKAAARDIRVTAWTIGAHNTRLGLLHPDRCVINCFGDSYPHALCPAHPDVRRYLMALCQDIGGRYPVHALTLESFDYGGWKHGHQHERDCHALTGLEKSFMNLCFNPATMAAAEAKGLDAQWVRQGVAQILQSAFDNTPERREGHPCDWAEAETQVPGVTAYRESMNATNSQIAAEAADAMVPALCHDLLTSSLGAYGEDAAFVRQNVTATRKDIPNKPLWVGFQLGAEQVPSWQFLADVVVAGRESGAEGMVFYNYSETPRRLFDWLGSVLHD